MGSVPLFVNQVTPRSVLGILGFGGQKVAGKHRYNHFSERYIARDEGQGEAKGKPGPGLRFCEGE